MQPASLSASLIEPAAERSDPALIGDALLREAGWPDARVCSFQVLLGSNPKLSQVFRIFIKQGAPETSPSSMILKIPVGDRVERRLRVSEGQYLREAGTFEVLREFQGTTLPVLFACAFAEDSETAAFLMEDVGAPTIRSDWTLDRSGRALEELAKLHSGFWDDHSLDGYKWMRRSSSADIFEEDPALFGNKWEELLSSRDRKAYRSTELMRTAEFVGATLTEILAELDDRPKTLTHGDLHEENLMLRHAGTPGEVSVIIDWQCTVFGGATSDIAKFLGTGPDAETLAANETHLLRRYHSSLEPEARDSYSLGRLQHDYRKALLATFANYVIAAKTDDVAIAKEMPINHSLRSVAHLIEITKPLEKLA